MTEYLLISLLFVFSYILGAIPFAYIFTKIFTHKDIMKIGWNKSSASNVMKNIGKLPGILTFIFDVLKGFAVIYLAQQLGMPVVVQAICGFLAVIGHNWSIFLGFRGGRGLAVLIGAGLAFNYIMMLVVLVPVVVITLLWTASVGTIVAYVNQADPYNVQVYYIDSKGNKLEKIADFK